jgi:hypothetical protein
MQTPRLEKYSGKSTMVGTSKYMIIGTKGDSSNGPQGMKTSPNRNKYEILLDGDNVPTLKIVGIPMFNARSNIIPIILEENIDFVPSPIVEINITNHDEDFPMSQSKDPFSFGVEPNSQHEEEERLDKDKVEQVMGISSWNCYMGLGNKYKFE